MVAQSQVREFYKIPESVYKLFSLQTQGKFWKGNFYEYKIKISFPYTSVYLFSLNMAFLLRFHPQLWLTGVTGWLILSFFTISRSPFSYPLSLFYFMREKWESYLGSREPRIQMTLPPPPCPFKIYIQVQNDQFANWISWLLGSSVILVGALKHQV